MKLSKQEFIEIIKKLQENIETCDKINEIISTSHLRPLKDWFDANCLIGPYEYTVIRLLEIIMNDEDEWISYFVCECDFGKNKKYSNVIIENTPFELNCVESLWELLQLTKIKK